MAQRATSLGPKPSLCSFCFCFFWFVFLFFLCFPFFFFNRQKNCFPPKKGHFLFIFQCLPLFLFSLFWASPLSSLSLSVSLSCSFISSFLFFIFSFWFLLFLFVVFAFLFQDVLLFLFFCLLSCVVLNHNISFLFALHMLSSFCSCFLFCLLCFLVFFDFGKPIKTHL